MVSYYCSCLMKLVPAGLGIANLKKWKYPAGEL